MRAFRHWILGAAMIGVAWTAAAEVSVGPREGLPSDKDYFEALYTANSLVEIESYDEAFPWLLKSAEFGDKGSQHLLAVFYYNGYGTEVDFARAYAWASVAAESGRHQSRRLRDHIAGLFNTSQLVIGNRVAEIHVEQYGMEARDMVCKTQRRRSSALKDVSCYRAHYRNSRYYGPASYCRQNRCERLGGFPR
ncbi:MAG: hypothetical protein AAGA95_03550 [Pseudomonadota bacterium]